jgi:hypothetical protein
VNDSVRVRERELWTGEVREIEIENAREHIYFDPLPFLANSLSKCLNSPRKRKTRVSAVGGLDGKKGAGVDLV